MTDKKSDITTRFLLAKDEVTQQQSLTLKEFAASVGEYPQNISAMESGKRVPTLEQVAALCDQYGYSANWVLLNKGPKMMEPDLQIPLEHRVHELELQVRMIKRLMPKGGSTKSGTLLQKNGQKVVRQK